MRFAKDTKMQEHEEKKVTSTKHIAIKLRPVAVDLKQYILVSNSLKLKFRTLPIGIAHG